MKSIYLVNKDLRIHDNKALIKAQDSASLLFVFLLPPDFSMMSSFRKNFLSECLLEFQNQLKIKNHELYVIESMDQLFEADVKQVITSQAFNSKDEENLNILRALCELKSIKLTLISHSTLYKKSQLSFINTNFPNTFTSFRKQIEQLDLDVELCNSNNLDLPPMSQAPESYIRVESVLSKKILGKKNNQFHGGESHALKRLEHYLWNTNKIQVYKNTRNGMIEFDDSSKFSPWLSTGCLSPRLVYHQVKSYEQKVIKNQSTYWLFFELLWRDYFKFYSSYYQYTLFELGGPASKNLTPDPDQNEKFEQWLEGTTENEFINANMKELKQTGWMSNRGRQNTANYLAKTLNVNWTWGAKWFEKYLIDYDTESNWGNWAYQAGVGSDIKDRVFNPKKQQQMYDPDGEYQKIWLHR